jgi:fructokinase
MMNNNLIVGLGEVLWDCLPQGRKLGGAPANFAYHVSQFGFESCVISAIGNDDLGHEMIDNFNEKGLHYNLPFVSYPTGTVQVSLNDKGIPQYDICTNVAWDNIPFTDALKQMAENTHAVCFGSLAQRNEVSRKTIYDFLEHMPQTAHTLRVFDINLRQHFYSTEIIKTSLEKCNVLKINDEELIVLRDMFGYPMDTDGICQEILKTYNLRMLILTCGTEGSYVYESSGSWSFLATPIVEVADTVGAGDSFAAAFVASILLGKTIQEAHQIAVQASAFVCTQHGAMPILPDTITGK